MVTFLNRALLVHINMNSTGMIDTLLIQPGP